MEFTKSYIGGQEVLKVYVGTELVFSKEVESLQIPTGIQLDLLDSYTFTYYVSEDGTGSGLSDSTPMSYSDARTAISTMNAGEAMGFRRSDTFSYTSFLNINSSGDVGNPITFGAYGTGFKPKIDSTDIYTGTWTNQGSNIWVSEVGAYNEQNPRLKINGNEVLGTKIQAELGTLIPDRVVFWNDNTTDTIHLYSTTDPSLDEVMYMRGSRAVYAYEQDNLVFDGIEFIGGYYGALMLAGTNNIEVKNCKLGDMCASGVNITDYGTTTCSNISVHDNDMNSSFPFDYRGGTVDDSETTERGSSDGVKVGQCFGGSIYNNTFFDWGHTGVSLTAGTDGETVTNFTVYDNTFSLSALRDYGGGFTIDRDSSGHEVYNNTMTGCKSNQVNGHGNHFHHNDVINTRQTALYTYAEGFGVDMATYAGDVYDNIIEFNNIINAESGAIRLRTNGTRNSGHRIRNNVTENCGSQNNNITVELNYGTTGIYDVNFDDNNFYNATETLIYLDADTANYEDIAFLNASTKYGINANNVNQNPVQPSGSKPVLSNFRIESAEPSRVYFDADSSVAGMTYVGFVISGKTISSLTIDGDGLGGYFTVTTPFDWTSVNTIRLGGLDGATSGDGTIFNFTLEYITNNIPEPVFIGTTRYVDIAATGTGDGSSEANAYTSLQTGLNNTTSGDKLYVKKGTYPQVIISNPGTLADPIWIIGYNVTPDDNPVLPYVYGEELVVDPNLMPVIAGQQPIDIDGCYYTIINHIQIGQDSGSSDDGFYIHGISGSAYLHLDYVYVRTSSGGGTKGIFSPGKVDHISIKNSVFARSSDCIELKGDFCLIDNVDIYNGSNYHTKFGGSNIVVRNSRMYNDQGAAHCWTFKGDGSTSEYNLMDGCSLEYLDTVYAAPGLNFWHKETKYNVVKNHVGMSKDGISLWGGSYNIVENSSFNPSTDAISLFCEVNDDASITPPIGNIIQNTTFKSQNKSTSGYIYSFDTTNTAITNGETQRDNNLINCTVYDISHGTNFRTGNQAITGDNFVYNTIIYGQDGSDQDAAQDYIKFIDNCYWLSDFKSGTGNVELDPQFVDAANDDFTPQNDLLIDCTRQSGVEYDMKEAEREPITTMGAIKNNNE